MMKFVPVFPLNIVSFPTEVVSLHIFEPRYKQLIKECIAEEKPFGMPVVFDNKVQEVGTLMQVQRLEKEYEDGSMDIRVLGLQTFNVLEFVKNIPDKLYGGGVVTLNEPKAFGKKYHNHATVIQLLKKFHNLLDVEKKYRKSDEELTSYDIAHHIGMALEQEYEVLKLEIEAQRMLYIQKHLEAITIGVTEHKSIVERILLNGHFRHLSLKDFDL
jgi:uncharacterized protein